MDISDIQKKAVPVFEEYGITYAGVFGSFSRGESKVDSDVDFMVRFGKPIGLFTYMRFLNRLESSLQKKVDVVTENSINKHVRPYIIHDLKTIYET